MLIKQRLEEIVGEGHVIDDPKALEIYIEDSSSALKRAPNYVVQPAGTAEVQKIVQLANEEKMPIIPSSSGIHRNGGAMPTQGGILVDLRRMNRILEIDEKNMYAVVEPYVIGAQLQVEAMKRGLNCHIVGAAANFSPLASCTSFCGHGLSGIAMGYSARNPLALEWVLPTGNILRLGALGAGAGWFCGDGPGLSLRGVMRGFI